MHGFRLRLPSPALIVASIALVLALAGTGYASWMIGTRDIKNGAITTKKLRNGAVTTAKLAPGAVTASNINPSGLTVPNAQHASTAGSASSATNATNATTATNAGNAKNATNATHADTADVANGLGTLPSGHSESGVFAAAGGDNPSSDYAVAAITFPVPLAAPLDSSHTIDVPQGTKVANCQGPGQAAPGYFCLYEGENNEAAFSGFIVPGGGTTPSLSGGAAATGTVVYYAVAASGNYVDGQWTVTAP